MASTNPYAPVNVSASEGNATVAEAPRNRVQEVLMGLVFMSIGAGVLFAFGTATIPLSFGISALTAGALLISGKHGKKTQAEEETNT